MIGVDVKLLCCMLLLKLVVVLFRFLVWIGFVSVIGCELVFCVWSFWEFMG